MTCPTCDKVFVARSILERHLKTSGHGGHAVAAADLQPQAPGPGMTCVTRRLEFKIVLCNCKLQKGNDLIYRGLTGR